MQICVAFTLTIILLIIYVVNVFLCSNFLFFILLKPIEQRHIFIFGYFCNV